MSPIQRPLLALVLLLAAACAGAPVAQGPVVSKADVPKIEATDQSFTSFTAVAHVQVPGTGKAARATSATYELLVVWKGERRQMASGTVDLSAEIPADGGVVQVAVPSPYASDEDLGEVLEDEAPLEFILRGSLSTDDDRLLEFSRAGMVRTPRVPVAKVWHVEASAQENEISLVFFLRVENPNPFELDLEGLVFDLSIDGLELVKDGRAGRKQRVPPSSTAQVEIPYVLGQGNFPAVAQVIRSKRSMEYVLDGVIRLGIGHIPIELTGPIDL
ncbi:MAG TPA: LEA type 2 family protein [Vulgatibacter sp.]|nr:LEA type 2 family protein [Vulgatibacter sp.]